MATTNHPTITATLEAATKKGSAERAALVAWLGGSPLTREQKRLVAKLLKGSPLGTAFGQISGVYA